VVVVVSVNRERLVKTGARPSTKSLDQREEGLRRLLTSITSLRQISTSGGMGTEGSGEEVQLPKKIP
jgi:hypothetical protein